MDDHPCQVRAGAGGSISSDWCIGRYGKVLAVICQEHGSFAGPMPTNLICMLDGIGLAGALEIDKCRSLFEERSDLVATTSAICHPIFVDGENYGGSSPKIASVPVLRSFVHQVLAANLARVAEALVVPLDLRQQWAGTTPKRAR
jgi:hypothetical protein